MLTNFIGDFERKQGNIIPLLVGFNKQKLNFTFKYILNDGLKIRYSYSSGYATYPNSVGGIFHNLA